MPYQRNNEVMKKVTVLFNFKTPIFYYRGHKTKGSRRRQCFCWPKGVTYWIWQNSPIQGSKVHWGWPHFSGRYVHVNSMPPPHHQHGQLNFTLMCIFNMDKKILVFCFLKRGYYGSYISSSINSIWDKWQKGCSFFTHSPIFCISWPYSCQNGRSTRQYLPYVGLGKAI